MRKILNREFNMEDIFAHADELNKATNIINNWSNEAGILINFRDSGILNIVKNTKAHKIATANKIHLKF